ncbi:hypothetical protein C7Y69_05055 [Alteromonas sp. KS69]|jgi:2-polyprenyl-3-methyl-5-hydroxy-6-metoxy-1,4-benzoquinol methylase|uniref:class I SAM-dependent methyltransferase n=1 Tax=Alteromonas sp. KS69 TaxID=2109917 RepID=UPI000F85DB6C|nr:class I SAM-dependent methyltransferase [Alteromonas sp. KS69]RUP82648.1 hypothetical protein C7Y69_05055 [Alteromonas sp. KS69]|tara:strand:+ start:10641 stop:11687 length:1047 start_codon:yes stop_codon:yes gene_type:complete
MLNQFGKNASALLLQKKSFFEENETHVEKQRKIAHLYVSQPERNKCKNCDSQLGSQVDFTKDTIPYKICRTCSHLNGAHEDTSEFCETVYAVDDSEYAQNYNSKDKSEYEYRTASIYVPKAEFLFTALKSLGIDPHDHTYFDYGAGSGYFVSALLKLGLNDVTGSDVSKSQVDLANTLFSTPRLSCHSIYDGHEKLATTKSQVVSMIGVLEHLQSPRLALKRLVENTSVEYIFISVPTFSLSVYLEMLDDNVFHRQLHGGHTHLYTNDSLDYMCNEFNLEIIGQWWFGTDLVDLYRQLHIKLEKNAVSSYVKDDFSKRFLTFLDSAQLEIDKQKESSEVHLLLRKSNA